MDFDHFIKNNIIEKFSHFKQFIWTRYANPGFRLYLEKFKITPKILIEAGCHHGEDTIELIDEIDFKKIFAFEADSDAYKLAFMRLQNFSKVLLFDFGLGDKSTKEILYVNKLKPEDGTSGFLFNPSNPEEWNTQEIEVRTLDSVILPILQSELRPPKEREIFIWLDVEGYEANVLTGAIKTLDFCAVAQVEINMHDSLRTANYREVLGIMKRKGFVLVFAPLHPGFFGDAVFIHKDRVARRAEKLRGYFLYAAMIGLHSFVYPVLKKPK